MKKIITTFLFSFLTVMCLAQNDTLLIEDFNLDPDSTNPNFYTGVQPPGFTGDVNWYNWDDDLLSDASGQSRPGEWFWLSGGFAAVDSSDGCMASNSWTLVETTPVKNYLVTPFIDILDGNAVVHWVSAPRQTPRYLDGYVVLVSNGTNDLNEFTDTLFIADENQFWVNYPSDAPDSNYSSFFFIPSLPSSFVHGLDNTYIEYADDSVRHIGEQRPFSASLAAYSGQQIYIAFLHNSHDDNLFSIDDIVVTGTEVIGYTDLTPDPLRLYAYPNPALRSTTLNFTVSERSDIVLKVTDILGNEILKREIRDVSGKYSFPMPVENLSAGTYLYTVISKTAASTAKFAVVK